MPEDEISQNTEQRDFRIPLSVIPAVDDFYQDVLTQGFLLHDKVFDFAKRQIPNLPELPTIPEVNQDGDCVECTEQLRAMNVTLTRIATEMEIDRIERASAIGALVGGLHTIAGRIQENTDAIDTANSYTMQTRYNRRTYWTFAIAFYDLFAWFFKFIVILLRDAMYHWKGYKAKDIPDLEEVNFEEIPFENTKVKQVE